MFNSWFCRFASLRGTFSTIFIAVTTIYAKMSIYVFFSLLLLFPSREFVAAMKVVCVYLSCLGTTLWCARCINTFLFVIKSHSQNVACLAQKIRLCIYIKKYWTLNPATVIHLWKVH